jgi:hypothetical protein
MPLTPEAAEGSVEFQERKAAQWEKFAGPGLQLVRSANNSQWMLVCSTDGFYEGVVIGQLERKQTETKMRARKKVSVEISNAKKAIENRGIDLTDEQIEKVLDCWMSGKSAKSLKFVACVWGRDGEPVES